MRWFQEFVGREAELGLLRDAYEEARAGKPRVVAIVAESGFGKTRLVQEFYNWLSTAHDGVEGAGYWPDRLLRNEDNLIVNPDAAACGESGGPMPFLWWATRLPDPGARNEILVSAMSPAVEQLRPHLAAQATALERGRQAKSAMIEVGKGAASIATDVVGNLLSFGLLGIGKTVVETGKALYDIKSSRNLLEGGDAGPGVARKRAEDELTLTILGDLFRIVKQPPAGFAAVPLVMVVDDAQWLPQDEGSRSFVRALIDRARREDWPLLLVITTWEREWLQTCGAGEEPGSLADVERGDRAILLRRASGFEAIVARAFPGLSEAQVASLTAKADGNPRFLDELLLYLDRSPKLFLARDRHATLSTRGLDDALARDLAELVADRFEAAPADIRRALALASLQGIAFSPRLIRKMAAALALVDPQPAVEAAETPYAFVSRDATHTGAEFRQRIYHEIARDDLGNHLDEAIAETVLAEAIIAISAEIDEATDLELALAIERGVPAIALLAGGEAIERANRAGDIRTAGELAVRLVPLLADLEGRANIKTLAALVDAHWLWKGPTSEIGIVLERALGQAQGQAAARVELLSRMGTFVETMSGPAAAKPLRVEAEGLARKLVSTLGTPAARRELAGAVINLGDVLAALESPAAARPLYSEAEVLFRALAEEVGTPQSRRDLALAINSLSSVIIAEEGPVAARPWLEEVEALCRALASELGTPQARSELTGAISNLTALIAVVEGPAAAKLGRVEHVALARVHATELGTPDARRDLAVALRQLGETLSTLEGPTAARPWLFEAESLFRTLALEVNTPAARHDLAVVIALLGDVVGAVEGPSAAKPMRVEQEALCRALVADLGTLEARRSLSIALSDLGDVVDALDGPSAAKPMRVEVESLCRQLFADLGTPGARGGLASAVSQLGMVIFELEGPLAAKPWCIEAEALSRALAAELGTPGAKAELAGAISNLADVLEALEGPVVARPCRVEAEALFRALAHELGTPGARHNLAFAISRLGNAVEALEGPAAAKPLRVEEEEIARALAAELGTAAARRGSGLAMTRLGDLLIALDGPAAAKPWRVKVEALFRTLASESGTPGTRQDLAVAISKLADVVLSLEGPTAAKSWYVEAEALFRALVTELGTPGAKRDLAAAVSRLGDVAGSLDGPAAAKPWRVEEVALLRPLAAELGTPGAHSELGFALSRLGDIVDAMEGPTAAKQFRVEEVALSRATAAEVQTPSMMRNLAIAVSKLGDVVESLEGSAAAKPWRVEGEALCRAVQDEIGTSQARLELSYALARLSGTVEALEGAGAAQALRYEQVALCRTIVTELGTPGARDALGNSILQLANVIEAIKCPAVAKLLRLEAESLLRVLASELGTPSSTLASLCASRDRLRGDLLGSDPWHRAFAVETIPSRCASQLLPDLEGLLRDFEAWSTTAGDSGDQSFVAAVAMNVARARFASGNGQAARITARKALEELRVFALKSAVEGKLFLASSLLIAALIEHACGSVSEAEGLFVEGREALEQFAGWGEAAPLRAEAALCWFYAELMVETGRQEDAMSLLAAGLDAAKAFARFGQQDGAAILSAYQDRVG